MKTFQVADFTLLVGETAQENWDLIDQAKKIGWFFHLTDFASPYLVLECGKVEPNAHVKLRCAEICVEHSKHKNAGKVKVDATPVANVKVDKKDAVGECDYKNEGKVEIITVQTGKKAKAAENDADNAALAAHSDKSRKSSKDKAGKGYSKAGDGDEKKSAGTSEHVSIRKSETGGWATVTFKDVAVRNSLLRELGESGIAVKSGVTVKLQTQVDPSTKEEVPSELFISWGRKVEEKTPVTEAELLRIFDELSKRAASAVAKAAPLRAQGGRVEVRKAAAGGVAVLSFQDSQLRNKILANSPEVTLENGVVVKLQPQKDPKTKEEVPTDIFAAWGRKVEEKTPVPESELLQCIERLCDSISGSSATDAPTTPDDAKPDA